MTTGRVSTGRAIDVDVDESLGRTVVMVVVEVGLGATLLFGTDIATELSTSMAITSAGEEPHDIQNNRENANVGALISLSRGVISRD